MKTQYSKLLSATASVSILMGMAFAQTASAASAPVLKIENFIGTIDVQTGNYDKITVTDADGAPIQTSGNDVLIDAGYTLNNTSCKGFNANISIRIGSWSLNKRKGGYKKLNEYPKIKITAPRDTHLNISKSVIFGDVDTIGSGHIRISSCGDLDMKDVTGALDIGVRGSGDVKVGNTGPAEISISGSGDITMGNAASANISISGSGDIEAGNVIGATSIVSRGSGDVELGRIDGNLEYNSAGSGDFYAAFVNGRDASFTTRGSGDIKIDGGDVDTLYIETKGSGDVRFEGNSVDAIAKTRGSGDVYLPMPAKHYEESERGSGDVHILN